jgi:hypothetical protein
MTDIDFSAPKSKKRSQIAIRACLSVLSEADIKTTGINLDAWSDRAVREQMCERLIFAEGVLEYRYLDTNKRSHKYEEAKAIKLAAQAIRRKLEQELYP